MDSPGDEDDRVFYRPSLPPSLPVVTATVDGLLSVASKQRLFIANHADKLRLELDEEMAAEASTSALASKLDRVEARGVAPPEGEWRLNGFSIDDASVLDLVRASPDTLSNLEYVMYTKTGLLAKLAKFFKFGTSKEERTALNVADDLAYVLTVAEVVEISGHVLSMVSHALSSQSPKIGKPLVREVAFELTNSRHRGSEHSMYLLATMKHERQNAASKRKANTLNIDLSLYLHTPDILGSTGVAVNVSGDDADDIPSADVDAGELQRVLSKRGIFCSRSSSNFVVRQDIRVTSERAARVATVTTERLVDASNDSITAYFENESATFAAERAAERATIEEELRAAKRLARQEEERQREREKQEEVRRENAELMRQGVAPVGVPAEDSDEEDWW